MRKSRKNQAFALIITVILVSLLAVLAVAFLSSSRLERGTARAVADKVKADLAAQTAVNTAIARFLDNLSTYPDSSTTWERVHQAAGTAIQYEGTTLYYRDKTPEANAASTTAPPLHAWPLISGAQPVTIPTSAQTKSEREANLQTALPVLDNANSFDLNRARFSNDLQGAIGAPPGSTTRPEFRGQWVDVTDSDGKLTARYAYWMEDESFKVNVNLMGNTARGSNSLGKAPSEIPLQGILQTVLTSGDPNTVANDIFNFRGQFPNSQFFEYRALNQDKAPSTLSESAKFEATIYSGASNLSRSGSKRVNLNKVIKTSTDPVEVRKQLDQIISAIAFALPNFGERFYRTTLTTSANYTTNLNSKQVSAKDATHPMIYLNKIAANIRDYIDTDSQPTVVSNDAGYPIRLGAPPPTSAGTWTVPPDHALGAINGGTTGDNEVIAVGKEAVPFFSEYMLRVKQLTFDRRGPYPPPPAANYKIEVDHYLEFWNMTNRDIQVGDLGPNPFLRIANQFGWDSGGASDVPEGAPRDFSVPLANFSNSKGDKLSFPAGSVTVLTTDISDLPAKFYPPAPGNIVADRVFKPQPAVANAYRVYTGQTTLTNSNKWMRLKSKIRSTSGDYETEIILGNDLGTLDSFSQGAFITDISVDVDAPAEGKLNPDLWHFRGSRPNGNVFATTPSTTGDPRTNVEQLALRTTTDSDRTRFKAGTVDSKNQPGETTFTLLNSNFVDTSKWVDLSDKSIADKSHAPAVIANAPMTSIGELGNIYDPTRLIGASGDIRFSRGGGRTLKVGQPERFDSTLNPTGLWDGDSNSLSREWTSWRLADIFSTSDSLQLEGRVNVNGVTRDNGAALKAALFGYNFQLDPNTDPQIAGTQLTDPSIQKLVDQLTARVTNDDSTFAQFSTTMGPFAEPGEISEMPIFNTGKDLTNNTTLMETVYDRGREELYRRLSELITTRGNVFTVYAVGQALVPKIATATATVTSTSQCKVTFRIDPVWNAGTPNDPFDPTDAARFKKPDKYAIKILYSGD